MFKSVMKESGDSMIEVGMKAPEFSLSDQDGQEVSLADFMGKKVVLYFYPRDNTPGCTTEANDFKDLHEEFRAIGVQVIGVSKDSVKSHTNFCNKYGLTFTLLSDPDLIAIKAYDVYQLKKMYGKESMGVVRSTFVIDEEGKIALVYNKVKVKDHAKKVLSDIKSL